MNVVCHTLELFCMQFSNVGLLDVRNAYVLLDVKSILMTVTFFKNLALYQLLKLSYAKYNFLIVF